MAGIDERGRKIDDFWDVSDLIPKKNRAYGSPRSTETVSVELSAKKEVTAEGQRKAETDTVITRYISSSAGDPLSAKGAFEELGSYEPKDSLIHRVVLKRYQTAYPFYRGFLQDALRYFEEEGEECSSVPYFSYVPQYDQLSEEQLRFYLYFRSAARRGEFLPVDYSYLLLYIYELLNLGARQDTEEAQRMLTNLWIAYADRFPALEGKLADWICDFSLIHRLPPPKEGGKLFRKVRSLKEFYIAMPEGDRERCARSLLRFCCSYDYHGSKFATEENLPLFDQHVFAAVLRAVAYFSEGDRLLSAFALEDSTMARDAYAGALTVAEEKYRIELSYCSFSRSNELRFLIGDVVKYAENKLRAYLGIKSRMTVYSLPTELRNILDVYFSEALPKRTAVRGKQEKQAYETLYDLPRKPFSLTDAEQIERDSWDTTRELVEEFADGEEMLTSNEPLLPPTPILKDSKENKELKESEAGDTSDLKGMLGELYEVVRALLEESGRSLEIYARSIGKMPELLVEEINEIGYGVIGDALIEERDGAYAVIEDYMDLFGA